jgi:hypothetical protein
MNMRNHAVFDRRSNALVFRLTIATFFVIVTALLAIPSGTRAAATAPAAAPPVAPLADAILTKACGLLTSSDSFSFHADILFDQLLPSQVKVQFAAAMDYAVQRPDELAVVYDSDIGAKRIWYHGKTLTIYDPPHAVYAVATVPDSIEDMFEYVAKNYHLTMPLADLAYSDPCAMVRKRVIFGGYIGVNNVNGVACDHVAFSSKNVDLQLWVDHTGKPILRKIVITYRSQPGSPEFIAFLSNWKYGAKIPGSHFKPELPASAKRIEFLQVKEAAKP